MPEVEETATMLDDAGADDREAVADEHTADAPRAVNFQCWVYGIDERDSGHLVSEDGMTSLRA